MVISIYILNILRSNLNDLSILLHGKKCFVLKCSNWLLGGYGLPLTVHFTKTFTPYIHCNDSSKTVRSVRKTLLKYSILITLYSNFGLIKWVINITVKTSNASSFFFQVLAAWNIHWNSIWFFHCSFAKRSKKISKNALTMLQ